MFFGDVGRNYLRRVVLRLVAERPGTKASHFNASAEQMRHNNAQTTMNIYTEAVSDSLRSAMEDFDQKMSAINGKQNSGF